MYSVLRSFLNAITPATFCQCRTQVALDRSPLKQMGYTHVNKRAFGTGFGNFRLRLLAHRKGCMHGLGTGICLVSQASFDFPLQLPLRPAIMELSVIVVHFELLL